MKSQISVKTTQLQGEIHFWNPWNNVHPSNFGKKGFQLQLQLSFYFQPPPIFGAEKMLGCYVDQLMNFERDSNQTWKWDGEKPTVGGKLGSACPATADMRVDFPATRGGKCNAPVHITRTGLFCTTRSTHGTQQCTNNTHHSITHNTPQLHPCLFHIWKQEKKAPAASKPKTANVIL